MNRFSIAGLLAAGAMLFATLGCDTAVSEKEWAPEIPTTYAELDGTNSSDVTAVWDFSTLSTTSAGQWDGVISTSESTIEEGTEIEPSLGSKAALYAGTFKGKTNAGVLQSSKGTASLSSLSNAYSLVLNLEADSDVVIKAKGAGAAEAARLIAIYAADFDEDEKTATATGGALVYKDNLASTKDVLFQLKDAPAGAYIIYINGSSIAKIDTTATTSKPSQITALKITTAQSDIASFEVYETLTLDVVDTADASSLAKDAVWTTSDKSVATVKEGVVTGVAAGTAVIRARIGRFYDERTVTVTKSTKTRATYLAKENIPDEGSTVIELSESANPKLVTANTVGNYVSASGILSETYTDEYFVAGAGSTSKLVSKGANKGLQLTAVKTDDNTAFSGTFYTLEFEVTPVGTKKLSKVEFYGNSGKASDTEDKVTFKVTVGTTEKTGRVMKTEGTNTCDLGGISISEKTKVKVEFISNNQKKVSLLLRDLTLVVTE